MEPSLVRGNSFNLCGDERDTQTLQHYQLVYRLCRMNYLPGTLELVKCTCYIKSIACFVHTETVRQCGLIEDKCAFRLPTFGLDNSSSSLART